MPTLVSESVDMERKLWTAEEFLDWLQPKVHADLINGRKFMHSPGNVRHADLLSFLDHLLRSYLEASHLGGKLYREAVAVRLSSRNAFLPDLFWLSPAQATRLQPTHAPFAPAWVAEAISPRTATRDVGPKFAAYEQHGANEYWILDPQTLAHRFYAREGEFLVEFARREELIHSREIAGFYVRRALAGPGSVAEGGRLPGGNHGAQGRGVLTTQFPRLFYRQVVRHAGRHKLLAALNVFSVALGVSVYLAIQIANHSANRAFAASIDLVAGKANLEVQSPSGGFDETLLPKLAAATGVRAATPLVEGYATLPRYPGEYLQLLGVDVFTNPPFATFAIGGSSGTGAGSSPSLNIEQWLADPHAIAISDEFAHEHGLKVGDPVVVQINGREHMLTVRYLIRQADTAAGHGNSRIAALDIGWAQELLGKVGRLSSLQLLLDQPRDAARVAARLAKLVPPDVTVTPPGQRSGQVERMLAGFELNLGALSLISLLVGMFLIYNTVAASVVRRRVETGILRALGATRAEVQCMFLGEALIFGLAGVLLGIVGGTLLARYLLGREIARVISTLYLLVSVDRFYLTPLLVGSAFFFGLGSVLLAAWLPAREGAREDPIAALSLGLGANADKSRVPTGRWLLAGGCALALAGACSVLALTTGPAWLGFASAFFVLLGFAFAAPSLTLGGASSVQAGLRAAERGGRDEQSSEGARGLLATGTAALCAVVGLATQNLGRSLHRNAIIIAALMAAIAMTIGISVMIFAFRQTVEIWINRAIVADIFMTPAANETLGNGALFPPEVLAAIRREPGIRAVDTVREMDINVRGDRVAMAIVEGEDRNRLAFVGGGAREKLAAFHQPNRVLVSEPFAHRYHVETGDSLSIPTPDGILVFRIAGVYYDYSRDAGIVAISRANFISHWHDDRVMSAAIYLQNPAQLDAIAARLRAKFNTHGEFLIFSNQAIRERVFEIFAQTFRITGVLRGIAVVVAVIGIFLTLTDVGHGTRARDRRHACHRRLARPSARRGAGRECVDRDLGQHFGRSRRLDAFGGADLRREQGIFWLDHPVLRALGQRTAHPALDRGGGGVCRVVACYPGRTRPDCGCRPCGVERPVLSAARRHHPAMNFTTRLPLIVFAILGLPAAVLAAQSPEPGWELALPGWVYQFPRDHAVHPSFKTEWWYFTGNLQDDAGHAYGYELTFFREGVLPPGSPAALAAPGEVRSRFVQNDFKFAHFAISDLTRHAFYFTQKLSRGAFGDAGFDSAAAVSQTAAGGNSTVRLAWLDDWSLKPQADGAWRLLARAGDPTPMSIDLRVASSKPPVIEGTDGISRKAAGVGNASHYYSFTRLATSGSLAVGVGAPAASGARPKLVRSRVGQQSTRTRPGGLGLVLLPVRRQHGVDALCHAAARRHGRSGFECDVDRCQWRYHLLAPGRVHPPSLEDLA